MTIDNNNQPIQKIISANWIIPMTQDNHWLENHAILLGENTIIDIISIEQCERDYPDITIEHYPDHVLMPGFVNSHCHAAMNLLRGVSDDLPLKAWLETAIWPIETRFVDDKFVYQGVQHAIAEMLLSGTTCFQDMYFMPDQTAKAAQEIGIRASIGMVVIDFKTNWATDAQNCIDKGLDVFDQFKHSNVTTFNFAPHAPYTVSQKTLEKIGMLSNELNLPLQIHLHETAFEVESFQRENGERPLSRLKEMGLLSPLLNAVHMTQLNAEEISWLAESGSHVIHCPQSNMKLASGICPVAKLQKANVNVAIGTDGAASNNDLDMIDEMRTASLLAKLDSVDPTSLSAYQTLYSATMGGAKALGLQEKIGTIETGKLADIIAIDLNQINTQPVYNPISQIVYSSSQSQITNVWVNGKQLLKNRELTTINTSLILKNAKHWQQKISQFKS